MKLAGVQARKFVEKPDRAVRAVLAYGPNASLVSETIAALATWASKGSTDPYAIDKIHEDEIKRDAARLGDALSAQSLLGGETLVWARIDGRGADAAILGALKAVERGEPLNYLLIEGGDLGGTSEIVKAFNAAERAAAMVFYEESEAERATFARNFAAESGLRFARDAEEMFAGALPDDRALARREIEKLALYAHGLERPLSAEDLAVLLPQQADGALDEASAAAMNGRGAQAVEALARIDALSGISALRTLLRRALQLSEARLLMDQGLSASDAAGKLRPPVFWKERDAFANQLRLWSAKRLDQALEILWAAELKSKVGGAPQEMLAADAYRRVAKLVEK